MINYTIKYYIFIIKVVSLFILNSCSENNSIRTYNLPKNLKVNTEVDKNVESTKNLLFNKPTSWKSSSGSSMRIASFDVPYKYGVGDLSVIQLDGDGGGISSNVNRWRRQLSLEPLAIADIESKLSIYEGVIGKYSVIEIVDIEEENAFLCAIIPSNGLTIFVKLSLKYSGIEHVKNDFIFFCNSINI